MLTEKIDVRAREDGPEAGFIDADLVLCDECRGRFFLVYFVFGHIHLQCERCGNTLCQAGEQCGRPITSA
jgi:hypothetical protein